MEQMVREVTSNSKEEPQEVLMRELAKGTFTVDLGGILSHIWRRLAVKSNPHHPYKCLGLLEFLLREGNAELVQAQINNNLHLIQALTSFRLINDHHIDLGGRVRVSAASGGGPKATCMT